MLVYKNTIQETSVFKTRPASEPEIFWVMGHCGLTGYEQSSIGFT